MNFLVLDGETCNTPKIDGQLDVKNGQVYDLGGMVINEYGEEKTRFSFVNSDVFFGMPNQMREAYFSDKIPQYIKDINMGIRQVLNTWQIWKRIRQICKEYNVQAIVAHNAYFDITTLNATLRYQTKSFKRYFLPYKMKVIDSLKIARKVFGKDPNYIKFCQDNGYMTNTTKPRPRLTAEVLWRYISNNPEFIESHTGLEDVEIESKIFAACLEKIRFKRHLTSLKKVV